VFKISATNNKYRVFCSFSFQSVLLDFLKAILKWFDFRAEEKKNLFLTFWVTHILTRKFMCFYSLKISISINPEYA